MCLLRGFLAESDLYLMRRHMLPDILSILLTQAAFSHSPCIARGSNVIFLVSGGKLRTYAELG